VYTAPRINGFFIQPSLSYGGIDYDATTFSTQEHFDSWIQTMADVGATNLFYQWSARYEYDQNWFSNAYDTSPDGAFSYYDISPDTIDNIPTQSWSDPTTWSGADISPLERTLSACEKAGVKLWFGLYLNEGDGTNQTTDYNWWNAVSDQTITGTDSVTIEHHITYSLAIIDDITNLYGNHPAFGGFYFTIEIANNAFIPQENHSYLADILDRVADWVHTKIPGARIALSPFFNTNIAVASEFGAMWEYALTNSDFDIVILQDGVGVSPSTLTGSTDLISPYYQALKSACEKADKSLWANAELFTQDSGGSRETPRCIPSNIKKLRHQLETESAVTDTFICFGFNYMDPNPLHKFTTGHLGGLTNEAELRLTFYNDYKAYYDSITTSSVETNKQSPTIVSSVEIKSIGGNLVLTNLERYNRISIYSISGREVLTRRLPLSSTTASMNTDQLSRGLYIITLQNNDGAFFCQKVQVLSE